MARKKQKKSLKKSKGKRKNAKTIKHELQVIERELDNVNKLQWGYAKHMLKFGIAAWVFGVATFASALIIYGGPELITDTPPLSISLLILAAAVPIFITVFTIQKFSRRIKRLEHIRRSLLAEYERTLLKEVGKLVSK